MTGPLGILLCLVGRHDNQVKGSRRYKTVFCRRCFRQSVEISR